MRPRQSPHVIGENIGRRVRIFLKVGLIGLIRVRGVEPIAFDGFWGEVPRGDDGLLGLVRLDPGAQHLLGLTS